MQPLAPVAFDWYLQMKCQHVMDKNQFPDFTIVLLPNKLGRNSPDKKNVFWCAGVRQYIKMLWFFLPDRKQTLLLLSACAAFYFAKEFVNYLNSLSPSVCARLDSWSWLLCTRNLLFSVRYIAMSPLQLCSSFSDSAPENEMHPVSPLISFQMMNTSGAINFNTSNRPMQHCGREGATAAKSASLPQSIRSVKSISLCMFALVCNNYNLHPKQAW